MLDKTIYAIQCRETKRLYIGSTTNAKERVKAHFCELRRGGKLANNASGERVNSLWQEEYNQYGKEGFDVFIIEENIPHENYAEREDYYIKLYRSTEKEFGYNLIGAPVPQPLDLIYGMPEVPAQEV